MTHPDNIHAECNQTLLARLSNSLSVMMFYLLVVVGILYFALVVNAVFGMLRKPNYYEGGVSPPNILTHSLAI